MAGQNDGETPLYIAAESGYVEIVRTLVRAGVAVNKAKVCDHG
jgi:ankyrin repeat protein